MATETVIEIPSKSGLRGRLERLQQDFVMKAQAIRITLDVLEVDERQSALESAPKKFLHAINHRTGASEDPRPHREKRRDTIQAYVAAHPGVTTREISEALHLSNNTVLKYLAMVAKPIQKYTKGSRKSWQWTVKTTITPAPRRQPKRPASERRAELAAYLQAHSGETTREIAVGLGWYDKQVLKFGPQVGRMERQRNGEPTKWFARSSAPAPRPDGVRRTGAVRARQTKIRDYLTAHPETFTTELAKVVGVEPNSGFVRLVRTVAKPSKPTNGTQPIQWIVA